MNLPQPTSASESATTPLLSSHSILLLCGILFGMCVRDNIPADVKLTLLLTGTTGLIAFLALSMMKHTRRHSQQRVATLHAEERLDRHAHVDSRVTDRTANSPA